MRSFIKSTFLRHIAPTAQSILNREQHAMSQVEGSWNMRARLTRAETTIARRFIATSASLSLY